MEKLCLMNATNFSSQLFRNLWGYLPKLKCLKLLKATQITTSDYVHLFTEGKDVMKNLTTLDISGMLSFKHTHCISCIDNILF